jgi:hypothetical protein
MATTSKEQKRDDVPRSENLSQAAGQELARGMRLPQNRPSIAQQLNRAFGHKKERPPEPPLSESDY